MYRPPPIQLRWDPGDAKGWCRIIQFGLSTLCIRPGAIFAVDMWAERHFSMSEAGGALKEGEQLG